MFNTKCRVITIEERDEVVYAIGDIHGHNEHLRHALKFIEEDSKDKSSVRVVFLGDYVDRGPNSKDCIVQLIEFQEKFNSEKRKVHFLRGNHEDMLLAYLGLDGQYGAAYLNPCNGGGKTLESYGISNSNSERHLWASLPDANSLTNEEKRAAIGRRHCEFLITTYHFLTTPNFIFVHAGFDHTKSLEEQIPEVVTWIRNPWLQCIHPYQKLVVHGHTRVENATYDREGNKINLDTILTSNFLSIFKATYQNEEKIDVDLIKIGENGKM